MRRSPASAGCIPRSSEASRSCGRSFIVGINRTGTTLLHRLLSRDPQVWALRRYELTEPVLPSGEYATVAGTADDPRRAYAEELLGATNVADTLAGLHRTDIDEPEEDLWILWLTFSTWLFATAHHVPAYGRWLAEAGSRNAYDHHRRVMQHFTWQRRQREPDGQRSWLLKMPFHLMELEALLQTYPDAVFIQTHREPVEIMGSWNSIMERIRSFTTEPRPPNEFGAEQLAFMSGMLNGAMQFRAAPTRARKSDGSTCAMSIWSMTRWRSWTTSTPGSAGLWSRSPPAPCGSGSRFRKSSAGTNRGTSTGWRTTASPRRP